MELKHIDITRLSVSSLNMRGTRKTCDIANILPSVRARGVLVPLIVREMAGAGSEVFEAGSAAGEHIPAYEILAGKRRFHAALAVVEEGGGIEDLPCAVIEPGDDAAALEASLIENIARLDPDEMTRCETFTRLVREGRDVDGIALTFGLTALQVKRTLALGKAQAGSLRSVRASAEQQLREFLTGNGVRLDGTERRPTWIVACGLERQLSKQSFNRMATVSLNARGVSKSRRWDSIQATASISPEELRALAEHLLSAPGAIVGRCVRRHDIPQGDRKQMQRVFDFAWTRLRGYLGHRTFAELILEASRKSRYPEALCDAMLKGGFEAVLDEQMGLIGQLGDARGLEIVDQLANCILDRPSLVQFRRGQKTKLRIPVQAVTPFAGGEQRKSGKGKGGRQRSDTLRRAFNSPFWPHVLCTTSVGQEGLDFHLWCGRIVHWDLPSDPVDFEQREGRIARYGSLVVRRSLAGAHGAEALTEAGRESPFTTMLSIARRQPSGATGLERWWLPAEGRPVSVSFDWRFSLRSERRDQMLKELLNYRLALGQPDPDAFLDMLRRVGAEPQNARALAIDLSAISRRPPAG